ncbi:hypothetical protein ABT124_26130 [Streptomyces sp. NPDC001982]|uniref:hypothetical protein n=1 Tax=unclassified Streptomyces TaxID=2593676 RepID=UPI0033172D42
MSGGHIYLRRTHLGIFREKHAEEWKAGIDEVTDALDVLGIPYTVCLMKGMFPTKAMPRSRTGYEARIVWDDLHHVVKWMPSFEKMMDAVEAEATTD